MPMLWVRMPLESITRLSVMTIRSTHHSATKMVSRATTTSPP